MIEIINKQLLLQLVGYLCYWQMGFNSVFKGLIREYVAWYCKIKRNGGGGEGRGERNCDFRETRKNSEGKLCPETLHGNLCCVSSFPQNDRA